MIIEENLACCGIAELANIYGDDPKETIFEIAELIDRNDDPGFRFAIFSSTKPFKSGTELAAYIKKNKLGQVVKTRAARNPNSGNRLKVWTWTLSFTALQRWWSKNKPSDYEDPIY